MEHAITVVETAELRTLHLQQTGQCGPGKAPRSRSRSGDGWQHCRVLEVSDLLRALMLALPHAPDGGLPPSAAEPVLRVGGLTFKHR